jgi:hypothetical protein
MSKPETVTGTIDITPRGCETAEGVKRVNDAMLTIDSANARVADIATRMVDRLAANRPWDAEENDTLKAAIAYRKDAYARLLRAVAGVPESKAKLKTYPANVNGKHVQVTIPEKD